MARKPIPDDTQNAILLKSRRRCCLCFWLKGIDEVQKGQIAHLDQDNANPAEENLAFLCFDHHDDYDGTTRLAKGLKPEEVRHWRDELYREMEYRFRSFQKRGFELSITGFKREGSSNQFNACFRLKNTGEAEAKSPTVTIRLPEGVGGAIPERFDEIPIGGGVVGRMPRFDQWAATEEHQDIFEPNGRVSSWSLGGINPVLMAGHSFTFEALTLHLKTNKPGTLLSLEYRVDAEGMPAVTGNVDASIPLRGEEFLRD